MTLKLPPNIAPSSATSVKSPSHVEHSEQSAGSDLAKSTSTSTREPAYGGLPPEVAANMVPTGQNSQAPGLSSLRLYSANNKSQPYTPLDATTFENLVRKHKQKNRADMHDDIDIHVRDSVEMVADASKRLPGQSGDELRGLFAKVLVSDSGRVDAAIDVMQQLVGAKEQLPAADMTDLYRVMRRLLDSNETPALVREPFAAVIHAAAQHPEQRLSDLVDGYLGYRDEFALFSKTRALAAFKEKWGLE